MATRGTFDVVTGATGFTGRYITRRLLDAGRLVRNLTGHADRPNPFGEDVISIPYRFDDPSAMSILLDGAETLYNTYWVRFERRGATFTQAVENSRALFRAARDAGIRRVVHVSVANPSLESPWPYFAGKARVEEALVETGLSYAIIRPTVLFGREDILINNIAWSLRRFPVFLVPGHGRYRVQPVFVGDVADLAVSAAAAPDDQVLDAAGPETYTFDELLRTIAACIGSKARTLHVPPALAVGASRLIGWAVGDVMLTRDETGALMDDLLVSSASPTGRAGLREWLLTHHAEVGITYASEVARHFR